MKKKIFYYLLVPCFIFFQIIAKTGYSQVNLAVDSVEAEAGVLAGVTIGKATAGYSGAGYVTGLDNSNDKFTVTMKITEKGFYKLVIRYNSTSGEKTQNLIVNNSGASQMVFPKTTKWTNIDAGKYFLNPGTVTITIQSSWGWTDFDKLILYSAARNTYNIAPDLINANAGEATKSLYQFLVSKFNSKIIAGQTSSYYSNVKTISGLSPMIKGFDMQHYTQGYSYLWKDGAHSFGWEDNGEVKQAIDYYKQTGGKGIVTFQWHWHSPSGGKAGTNTFYTDQTTFDVTKAVLTGTTENTLILRDIDSIASQLKRLQKAGVPVLWRPLHEAGGAWFWWGAKGPVACKKLFTIIFDRLTNLHQLNNLIWVWSTPETDWYPGNNFIDIVGHDSYPGVYNYDIQKTTFDRLFTLTQGNKLIAMTENGPIPNPDDCLEFDAPWSYFMSWSDLVIKQNTNAHIAEVYKNPNVLTLEHPTNVTTQPILGESAYKVFPNPAFDTVHIEGDNFTGFELVDMTGRVVFTATNQIKSFTVKGYDAGTYILRIYNHEKVFEQKLVIR